MAIPTGGDTPSRYQPNPVDDRAITDPAMSATYLALSNAIEEVTDNIPNKTYQRLDPSTRRGIRSAENALRRAAFSLVIHAPDSKEGQA